MVNMPKNKALLDTVAQSWSEHASGHFSCEVALSGGLDSVVLLHLLCALRTRLNIQIHAVHIHHGLQREADEWQTFCQTLCQQWQVPLRVEKVAIDPNSPLGTEGAAREARYRIFSGSLQPILALAHHADDQHETFFLSLLRGGGVRGMAAMPSVRQTAEGLLLWRPLLSASRAMLADYAQQNQLSYVCDPSNQDEQYLRNWLRHSLLPHIATRLPEFSAHIRHNITACQHTLQLAEMMTDSDWQSACTDDFLMIDQWIRLPEIRRHALLYRFAKVHDLGVPRTVSIANFDSALCQSAQSTHTWHLPKGQAYAHANRLWHWADSGSLKTLCMANEPWNVADLKWQENTVGLPENWRESIAVRRVKADDVLQTHNGRKLVHKLLQEHKIPHFIRAHWPVLVDNQDQCLAVAGVHVRDDMAVQGGILPFFPILQAYCSGSPFIAT